MKTQVRPHVRRPPRVKKLMEASVKAFPNQDKVVVTFPLHTFNEAKRELKKMERNPLTKRVVEKEMRKLGML